MQKGKELDMQAVQWAEEVVDNENMGTKSSKSECWLSNPQLKQQLHFHYLHCCAGGELRWSGCLLLGALNPLLACDMRFKKRIKAGH